MVIVGMLAWWYGAGWKGRLRALEERLASLTDFFSIELLIKTLFSPYRQISAGHPQGPLGVQLRALADRIISRLIGAMIRTVMIIAGVVSLVVCLVVGLLIVILWGIVPILPIAGLALTVIGWLPWSI